MSTPPPADLLALVEAADLDGLDRYLQGLDPDGRTTVRRWFQRSRPWFREVHHERDWTRWASEMRTALRWVEAICAVSLMGPATAAKRLPWRDFRWYSDPGGVGERIVLRLLQDADATWAAQFAEAVDAVPVTREGSAGDLLARLLRATVVHHGLPCPTGSSFLAAWPGGAGGFALPQDSDADVVARLAQAIQNDPLMPDLLWHYLGSGHCGDVPHLPDALAALVTDGLLDRAQLVETVLTQLTTLPRVATQRVLANILGAVGLIAAEIPGGLDYLLGVLATANGSVGKVLLPRAIDLASEADDLLQLAGIVASRPERAQKDLLLRGLRDRGDEAGVVEALRVLSTGDDDAAFVTRAQQVIDRYAHDVPADATAETVASPNTQAPMGLWHQRPDPEGALADGEDPSQLAAVAVRMLGNNALSLPEISQTFEDRFLAGAMSRYWVPALSVADAACRRRPRPARLDVLLRLLARYAGEAPRQELPLQIAGFAAATGRTKAQMEARTLGATLSGETPEAYVARLRAAGAVEAAQQAPVPPLWQERQARERPDAEPVPAVTPIDAKAVAQALIHHDSEPLSPPTAALETRPLPFDLIGPDLMLRDVLRGTKIYGLEKWRDYLGSWAKGRSTHLGPTGQAISLWAQGLLSVETFWTLALRSTTWAEWEEEIRRRPDRSQDWFAASDAAGDLAAQVRTDRPVLPPLLGDVAAQLTFQRTAEVLLRVELDPERRPISLAIPAFQDGTINLAHLVYRLHRVGPQVGPLDLVQALHRLRPRPSDTVLADKLDLPPLMTVPELTSPEANESWDAAAAVRSWVKAGGAGPAEAGLRPNEYGWPQWTVRAEVAVPWSTCRAAPADLDEQTPRSSLFGPTVRVFPLQPDRVAFHGYYASDTFLQDFVHMRGSFGPASHRLFLFLSGQVGVHPSEGLLDLLAALGTKGLLDPEQMAETARQMVEQKDLDLPRLIESWRLIFTGGGLAVLWPMAVAVTEGLAAMSPPPPGLPQMVGLLAEFAPEVPPGAGADRVLALAGRVS